MKRVSSWQTSPWATNCHFKDCNRKLVSAPYMPSMMHCSPIHSVPSVTTTCLMNTCIMGRWVKYVIVLMANKKCSFSLSLFNIRMHSYSFYQFDLKFDGRLCKNSLNQFTFYLLRMVGYKNEMYPTSCNMQCWVRCNFGAKNKYIDSLNVYQSDRP